MLYAASAVLGLILVALIRYLELFDPSTEGTIMFGRYNKAITALVGAAISFATLTITSDTIDITSSEWLAGAIALATALGVYAAPNNG